MTFKLRIHQYIYIYQSYKFWKPTEGAEVDALSFTDCLDDDFELCFVRDIFFELAWLTVLLILKQ